MAKKLCGECQTICLAGADAMKGETRCRTCRGEAKLSVKITPRREKSQEEISAENWLFAHAMALEKSKAYDPMWPLRESNYEYDD